MKYACKKNDTITLLHLVFLSLSLSVVCVSFSMMMRGKLFHIHDHLVLKDGFNSQIQKKVQKKKFEGKVHERW